MNKILICHSLFGNIGGIETFIINFCKTFYKKYDITLLCANISNENAAILSDYSNIICEVEEDIECDTCIITSIITDKELFKRVKYKDLYQMIHCDFVGMKPFWNNMSSGVSEAKYISVSEAAQKGLKKCFGIDSIVIPNLLIKPEPKRILKLISATRLTSEKGYTRMIELAKLFEENNIPYEWTIYTSSSIKPYGNMVLKKPIQCLSEVFVNYDYVVQLSDTESFCYTMYEALQLKVPVLVTPFPNAKEEIKDGINGYILPFDMKLNNILDIYNNIPTPEEYKQKGVETLWKKILK